MDTKNAFWGMICEIGSSKKELDQIDICVRFDKGPIITLDRVEVGGLESTLKSALEPIEDPVAIAVQFIEEEIDLRDPESFGKLKDFIEKAKSDRLIQDDAYEHAFKEFIQKMEDFNDAEV